MENSSSDDRRNRSNQNRQDQRGDRRQQNNRNSRGGSNRRNRSGGSSGSGGGSNRNQGGGKREYRPSNRGRQTVKKQTFIQKILSFLGLGGDSKAKPPSSDRGRETSQSSQRNKRSDEKIEVTSERLYVGNLDYKTTGSDLEKHFSRIGTVKSAEIVINRRTQQSKGFAFVEMSSVEEARKAVSSYHNEDFMGRRMLVNGAKSQGAGGEGGDSSNNNRRRSEGRDDSRNDSSRRGDRNERSRGPRSESREEPRRQRKTEAPVIITSSRLKLDNLDYEVGEAELEELFNGIGVVVSTEVAANPDTHQSKGYGFVEMSHIDEAKRAVEILNNKDFMGRRLNISGAEATKEEAQAAETATTETITETAETIKEPETETAVTETEVVSEPAAKESIKETEPASEEATGTEAPDKNQESAAPTVES